jgi:hypothetical protein
VASSTQNQAFNAILFLYRHVLDKEIGDIRDVVRSNKKRGLPVVLTREMASSDQNLRYLLFWSGF